MTLFKSRKFWLLVGDVALSTATFFVTKYAAPDVSKDVLWLIAAWQPVFYAVINGIAKEDAAEKSARLYVEDVEE